MKRSSGWAIALCSLLTLGVASDAGAQEGEGRLLRMFLDHASVELDLTPEQRDELGQILRETFARRTRLAREARELQRAIRTALSDPSTADESFRRLSQTSLDLKRRELELLAWQRERVGGVLAPRQTLRFLLMQEQLARRIEAMRRDRKRR
jgi:hypothetical protein